MKIRIVLIYVAFIAFPFNSISQLPIDLTDSLLNADFSSGVEGWNAQIINNEGYSQVWNTDISTVPCVVEAYSGYGVLEMHTFRLSQDVSLEAGQYRLVSQAFYRWGSSYNSDINNTDGLGARSSVYLIAGDDSIKVKRLGDESGCILRPYNYANSMVEASAAFNAGLYFNTLCHYCPIKIGGCSLKLLKYS